MSRGVEALFTLDSDNKLAPDTSKVEKPKGPVRNVPRKKLADITNLPQHSNEYVDRLKKENTSLLKLLADRDKNNEPCRIELQKLRVQNMQLAQVNSEMLRELNSCKDKLKALRHELGCKSTLLKLISEGKVNNTTPQRNEEVVQADGDYNNRHCETRTMQQPPSYLDPHRRSYCPEAEIPEVDEDNNKNCHAKRRQRPKSLNPSTVKQVKKKKKAEKNSRKQSDRSRCEEPRPVEDLFEIADDNHPVYSLLDFEMCEDASTSTSLPVDEGEGDSDLCHVAQVHGSLSTGRRRQAAMKVQSYKEVPLNAKMRKPESEEPRRAVEFFKREKPRHAEEFFKTDEPRRAEEFDKTDDAEYPVCPLVDDPIQADDPSSIVVEVNIQGDSAPCHEPQEFGKRPSRRAATKVQSYKEIPINVKMRRDK